MAKLTLQDLQRLPKTDLHVHLDDSLRIPTILELGGQQKVKLPADSVDGLRPFVQVGDDCKSLVDYLRAFDVTLSVMQTYDSLVRTAFELAEDAARENVRYMEVRYSPILHQQQGLTLHAIVQAVLEGLAQAERQYNIKTGVILCGMRHISPDISLRLADLTVAFKNKGVVGFDLAGAEENFPAKRHKDAFGRVLQNNINCTLHAGEAYGPESIHQAIHLCGAHRIGHGVRLIEDGDLLNYVNDHRIPLVLPVEQRADQGREEDGRPPHPPLLRPGSARHREHGQPHGDGHHREPRIPGHPRGAGLQPGGDRGGHHHGLQERLPSVRPQARAAGGGGARAEGLQARKPGEPEGAALS